MTDHPTIREDILALKPGPPITEDIIVDVVAHVARHDSRIKPSEMTIEIWTRSVVGVGAELFKDIVTAYYAKHDRINPDKQPINPGWIKAEANTRIERAQNLAKLPPPKRKGGPPPHVAEYIRKYKERHPDLLERKP